TGGDRVPLLRRLTEQAHRPLLVDLLRLAVKGIQPSTEELLRVLACCLRGSAQDRRRAREVLDLVRRLSGAAADDLLDVLGDRLGDVIGERRPGDGTLLVLRLALEPLDDVVEEDAVALAQLVRLVGRLAGLAREQYRHAPRDARGFHVEGLALRL